MATIQELRALNEASPFRPFRVRLPSGEAYHITDSHSILCDVEGKHMSIPFHPTASGRLMDVDMASAVFEPRDEVLPTGRTQGCPPLKVAHRSS